ncbi:MAG: hypothetical protein Q4A71_01975 [Actinomycetaceae bacterium]|nr:hypothetical protein [Actinomycetaceae bacterium]
MTTIPAMLAVLVLSPMPAMSRQQRDQRIIVLYVLLFSVMTHVLAFPQNLSLPGVLIRGYNLGTVS